MSALLPKADIHRRELDLRFVPKAGLVQCGKNPATDGLLPACDGNIRSHVGTHLSVPKKWSKACVDGGTQSEMLFYGQCSEGWGERSCRERSGGLRDPALENQWQGCAPNTNLVKACSLNSILQDLKIGPIEWS
jgi:hypothetical protein